MAGACHQRNAPGPVLLVTGVAAGSRARLPVNQFALSRVHCYQPAHHAC